MARTDKLDLGVTLRLLLVESDLRVRLADLAEPPFHRVRQLAEVGWNAADRPDAPGVIDRSDRAAERAIGFDEELFDVFGHEPLLFAFLPVGTELGKVDVA